MIFHQVDDPVRYDQLRDVAWWKVGLEDGTTQIVRVSREFIDDENGEPVGDHAGWCERRRRGLEGTAARKLSKGEVEADGSVLITTRDQLLVRTQIQLHRDKQPIVPDTDPAPLKLSAWKAAEDAQVAIARLKKLEDENPDADWRLDYMAAAAALRNVGYALQVDRDHDPRARQRIDALWPLIRRHPVFRLLKRRRDASQKRQEYPAKMMTSWTWTGTERMEDATDRERIGILFSDDNDLPLVDEFYRAWDFWLAIVSSVMHNSFPAQLREDQLDPEAPTMRPPKRPT
jgi:hypothetical protein